MITGNYQTREIKINGKLLTPDRSLKLANHSPTGFAWGYRGSGPTQLALAILLEYTLNEEDALALYQQYRDDVICRLEQADFELPEESVINWLTIQLGA